MITRRMDISDSQPGRAKENSPPIYRWVDRRRKESRQGRKNIVPTPDVFFRPCGAFEFSAISPAINRWAIFGCPSGTKSFLKVGSPGRLHFIFQIPGILILLATSHLFAAEPPATNAPSRTLSLKEAEQIALTRHPRISEADLLALASKQVVREARSAYYPSVTFNATAVDALDENTRIAAGALNNPLIIDRESQGININQIITDFGRTHNLSMSTELRSRAEQQNAVATRAQLLLEVNSAYADALRAQSTLAVARQTVDTRQFLYDQVSQLASNQIKSELDASLARVSLQEARLLQAGARNDVQVSFAVFANLLAEPGEPDFQLVDEPVQQTPVTNATDLVELALRDRPELLRARFQREAAERFARAEHELHYPTLSAAATAGLTPARDVRLNQDFGAAGVNLSIPIFDGMLFSARAKEAQLKSEAAQKDLESHELNVVRDVRVAAINLSYALERMALTAQLLENANQAFELAQARYKVGSSSIVELSQAQLAQTQAQIDQARAKYEYQMRQAILDFQTGQMH